MRTIIRCNPTFFTSVTVRIVATLRSSKRFRAKEGRQEKRKEGSVRKTHIATEHIAGISCDVSCQPKVTDLRHPAVSQQNVSGCKIPVDALHAHRHKQTDNECRNCYRFLQWRTDTAHTRDTVKLITLETRLENWLLYARYKCTKMIHLAKEKQKHQFNQK